MIVGIYTDAHFSVSSSIFNGTSGSEYSQRLDSLINSFRWMGEEFLKYNVDMIINAGDLTDSPILKAREGSALAKALNYLPKNVPIYNLVGNHDKEDKDSKFTSISLLSNNSQNKIISEPTKINNEISLLPYISNYDNLDLEKIKNKILISHVDYKSMKVGNSYLDIGLDIKEVRKNFELVLNGHIHTASSYENDTVINIGSISGVGFGDNYTSYPGIIILDTETLRITRVPSPFSVLFFKFKINSISELIKNLKKLSSLENPKCLKVESPYQIRDEVRECLESNKDKYNLVSTRVHGRIDSSTIMNKEEIVKLQGYESGASAMIKYLDIQEDESLPSEKSKMLDFIKEYLM